DVAARYGGDEFVLLLPQGGSEDAALAARRISEEFYTASATILKRKEGVSMSIGVAALRQCVPVSADQLIAKADSALYKSKQAGRNRVSIAEGESTPVRVAPAVPQVEMPSTSVT